MNEYVGAMFEELQREADCYVLLREQLEQKRVELAKIGQRVELFEKLIALEQPDGATIPDDLLARMAFDKSLSAES